MHPLFPRRAATLPFAAIAAFCVIIALTAQPAPAHPVGFERGMARVDGGPLRPVTIGPR